MADPMAATRQMMQEAADKGQMTMPSPRTAGAAGVRPAGGARTILFQSARHTGKVQDWKDTFGWIEPEGKFPHPAAAKNQGKILFHLPDVETEITGVGSRVSFVLYVDSQGLGAQNVRAATGLVPSLAARAPQAGQGVTVAPRGSGVSVAPPGRAAGVGVRPPMMKLPRQRCTKDWMTGEVLEYENGNGWLKGHEGVSHASAAKNEGKIRIMQIDLKGVTELAVGDLVQFYVYNDAKGLGAEECEKF